MSRRGEKIFAQTLRARKGMKKEKAGKSDSMNGKRRKQAAAGEWQMLARADITRKQFEN
jgi:hypothetical protein